MVHVRQRVTAVPVAGALALAALLAGPVPARAQSSTPCPSAEARRFDFWIGEWNVLNRQSPPTDPGWSDTGTATDRVYAAVRGCAIIEHWRGTAFQGFVTGFSVRAWNPGTGQWDLVLLWPSPGQPRFGELHGAFRHGRGEFLARSVTPAGHTSITRFSFADITPRSLRWQSETSADAGATWSSSWIMEFTRRDPVTDAGLWNGPAMTTGRCPDDVHRAFDDRLGEWTGRRTVSGSDPQDIHAITIRILEGCATLERAWSDDGAWESLAVRAWEPGSGRWVEYLLSTDDPTLRRFEAPDDASPFVSAAGGGSRVTERSDAGAWGRTVETRDETGVWTMVVRIRLANRVTG